MTFIQQSSDLRTNLGTIRHAQAPPTSPLFIRHIHNTHRKLHTLMIHVIDMKPHAGLNDRVVTVRH